MTTGDRITDRPLKEIGGKGLFTREIEQAMLDGSIDIAVHSMKDMPTPAARRPAVGHLSAARRRARCVHCIGRPDAWRDLSPGSVVGTSSLRTAGATEIAASRSCRSSNFAATCRHASQGSLGDQVADATFLAMAGLKAVENGRGATRTPIEVDDMLPAVAQGAIGIERRAQ